MLAWVITGPAPARATHRAQTCAHTNGPRHFKTVQACSVRDAFQRHESRLDQLREAGLAGVGQNSLIDLLERFDILLHELLQITAADPSLSKLVEQAAFSSGPAGRQYAQILLAQFVKVCDQRTNGMALNAFQRNVSFRANRIFNPARIASFYSVFLESVDWSTAASALAYVGIPPQTYMVERTSLGRVFTYDPSQRTKDIVYVRGPNDGPFDVLIDVDRLLKHVLTIQLDIDLSALKEDYDASARRIELVSISEGSAMGARLSPHEWLMAQIPDDALAQHVRDVVMGIVRVALEMSLSCEWCESVRVRPNSDPLLAAMAPCMFAVALCFAGILDQYEKNWARRRSSGAEEDLRALGLTFSEDESGLSLLWKRP
ncbi:hypothetical protein FVE85_0976 [Porphyridium purpureum]|uniref:Uncharacterized protein n=1 Tax=Porphyridium purpureum TaxID=35688 RepID=A0A5J4Z3M9_PORPP|nr:hypothetical protein FVE85_0976 [Porphyridium purpureum]|eukprot:POR4163..scf208_2